MASYNSGHGISDNELARLTKLSQTTISRIANGTTKQVAQPTAVRLAEFFGVKPDQIRGEAKLPTLRQAAEQLSSEAIALARAWQSLDPMNKACFRDQILYLAAVQHQARWLVVQKPRSPNYEAWEQAVRESFEVDVKQGKARLEGRK